MTWIAVGVGVVGTVGSAVASNKASSDASKAAGAANDATLAQQKEIADQQRADMQPYNDIGLAAIPEYQRMLRGEEMKLSPIGQLELTESAKMMNRQDAARGLSGSGGAVARFGELGLKAYAQDYNDQYNRIFSAIGLGQQSAANQAGNAGQFMTNVGVAGGREQANILDQGQSDANLYSGIGGALTGAASLYTQNKGGSSLFNNGGTPSDGGGVTSGIGSSNKKYSLMS